LIALRNPFFVAVLSSAHQQISSFEHRANSRFAQLKQPNSHAQRLKFDKVARFGMQKQLGEREFFVEHWHTHTLTCLNKYTLKETKIDGVRPREKEWERWGAGSIDFLLFLVIAFHAMPLILKIDAPPVH
jgi:hypothetical protein